MELKEKLAAEVKAANALIGGDMTPEQVEELAQHVSAAEQIKSEMDVRAKAGDVLSKLEGMEAGKVEQRAARSLGDHFVKSAGDRVGALGMRGGAVAVPEFKAGTNMLKPASTEGFTTQWDTNVVAEKRQRLVVADLLSASNLTNADSVAYLVEQPRVGDLAAVAEGATKPKISYGDPLLKRETLTKLAGIITVSDELIEDLGFLKNEIDNRLVYDLQAVEEKQLLAGDGSGANLTGLLNREGVQKKTAASPEENADAVFQAMTLISNATDLVADGIVMNPADYESFRLAKDANKQYYGGGYFAGQYGNGGVALNPNIWGLNTVVTPAIEKGKCLVGAFRLGASLYRKGGIRLEATNSHEGQFADNLVTIRAEGRIALAVRYPAAFVELTLGAGA